MLHVLQYERTLNGHALRVARRLKMLAAAGVNLIVSTEELSADAAQVRRKQMLCTPSEQQLTPGPGWRCTALQCTWYRGNAVRR